MKTSVSAKTASQAFFRTARGLALATCLLAPLAASALGVVARFPDGGGSGACADTPLRITFDAEPAFGTSGTIAIHDADGVLIDSISLSGRSPDGTLPRAVGGVVHNVFPVLVEGRTALIFPRAGALVRGRSYRVTVDASVFPGFAGMEGSAWTFRTKPTAPPPSRLEVVVAADGTGDFCTVQGAVDWVPASNRQRRVITIRGGDYREIVRVSGRHSLHFRGEEGKRPVVSYPNNNLLNAGADKRCLWGVVADDISFDNLTLLNSTPVGGSQAEALRVHGGSCLVTGCALRSRQDTVLVNSASDSARFVNTLVEGDVDFVWGSGLAVFQNCEIRSLRGGYICQMRNPVGKFGAVFLDCRFTCAEGVKGVVLNRIDPAAFPGSAVALVHCSLGSHITPEGWLLNGPGDTSGLRFWEYQSTDSAGKPLDVSGRAAFSRQITADEAAKLRGL